LILADNQVPGFGEIVANAAQQILKAYPWVASIIIVLFAGYLIVGIVMAIRSEESSLFGIIKWRRGTAERARFNEERGRLIDAFNEVVISNRFFGLLLLMVRLSLSRYDRIRWRIGGSSNEDALGYLCEWISRAVGFQVPDVNKVTLFVPDAPSSTAADLIVKASAGLSPESARAVRLPLHDAEPAFAVLAFRTGRIQLCQDVGTDPRYHQLKHPPAHEYKSILAMPVMHGEKVIASFTIDSLAVNRFGPDDENQAKLFAELFALFMEEKDDDGKTAQDAPREEAAG
jgi:GAF domain-containing protein